jgi:predicted metal-binding membrane protein
MNEAAAPSHDWPGIRIQAIDIVHPPGIGIPAMADIDAHQTIVPATLAANSSAETPENARSALVVLVMTAPPQSGLVAPQRRAIEPLVHAPKSVQPARVRRVRVVDGAAASFMGMWIVMMVAMMLPSLVPMLRRYRDAVGRGGAAHLGRLTALVAAAYFLVWTLFGVAAFPVGVGLAEIEMREPALARAVPSAVGVVVLLAGFVQLTRWKARHLDCCRAAPAHPRALPADARTAFRHGLRLGVACGCCCAGLMAILLVIGVMDLRAMAVVAAAITVERIAPTGGRIARVTGAVAVAAGLVLIARAS